MRYQKNGSSANLPVEEQRPQRHCIHGFSDFSLDQGRAQQPRQCLECKGQAQETVGTTDGGEIQGGRHLRNSFRPSLSYCPLLTQQGHLAKPVPFPISWEKHRWGRIEAGTSLVLTVTLQPLLIPTFQKRLLLLPEIFSGIVHLNLVLTCHNDPEFSGYQNDPTKLLQFPLREKLSVLGNMGGLRETS